MKTNKTFMFFWIVLAFMLFKQSSSSQTFLVQKNDSLIYNILEQINQDSITENLVHLQNFGTRYARAPNRKIVAEWIKSRFIGYGLENTQLDSFKISSGNDSIWQYNVISTLTGTGDSTQVLILGGHHDSYSSYPMDSAPGADDNATSVATAFEIARVLKHNNIQPRYTIQFMTFAGEELGLLGSHYYAKKARQMGLNIKAMINIDMIGYASANSDTKMNLHTYINSKWLSNEAVAACYQYTDIQPSLVNDNSAGSDSYSFSAYGYAAIFLQEFVFSPVYHSVNDLVQNLNMPYCTKIIKMACGLLLNLELLPSSVTEFALENPADGSSLIAHWNPSADPSVQSYKIRTGTSSGNYDAVYSTSDTTFELSGLTSGQRYFIGITSTDTAGYESNITELSAVPASVSLSHGILIIDDARGAVLNPLPGQIYSFYNNLTSNFWSHQVESDTIPDINLSLLGQYSSVIWHVEGKNAISKFNTSENEIRYYLEQGGNLLITAYHLSSIFKNQTDPEYPVVFQNQEFESKYLKINFLNYINGSYFYAANPAVSGIPYIQIDTLKTQDIHQHQLYSTEAISPRNEATIIYKYESKSDTSTTGWNMNGMPVGIMYNGSDNKVVVLSFSLYYMEQDQAKQLVEYILDDIFGEPLAVPQITSDHPFSVLLYPNPCSNHLEISVVSKHAKKINLKVFNSMGISYIKQDHKILPGTAKISLDLSAMDCGMYFLKIDNQLYKFLKKD